MQLLNGLAAALLFSVRVATASPTPSTLAACDEISGQLPNILLYSTDLEFNQEAATYWSTTLRDIKPACMVVPTTAEQVSTVVGVLNKYPDVLFAVKSGGHDPNIGHATVEDGILISMRDNVGATYDETTGLAHVKPGGEWNDVIGDLATSGVCIVGGRLGNVGVGGYLLQGGISFLSAQYAFAADNIVGWETVMANGSIVNVNATTQPDLAVAMRGSGSQFGVVTEFTVKAHPIGQVWGGSRIYTSDSEDELFAALHKFAGDGAEDPKAAIIFTSIIAADGLRLFDIFYFYDGPDAPTSGPFADFLDISSTVSTTKTQSYGDLLESNGAPSDLLNARINFRTYTLPYIPSLPSMYSQIYEQFHSITGTFMGRVVNLASQCSIDFQPVPSLMGKLSAELGGNAMGFSGSDPDRLFLEMQCSWRDAGQDADAYALAETLTDWLDVQVPQWLADAGLGDEYLPFFMNDAQDNQNVTGSYRDYAKFKALQEEADPNGLFSRRAGGFKY